MMVLLVLKERLRAFYGRFAAVVDALIKFVMSFAALMMLSKGLGFMSRLQNPLILFAIAALCAFLPYGGITFLLALVMLGHVYAASFELALLLAVFLVIIALLYYGFQPGDSYWLVLTPMAFVFDMPFVIPLLAGLSGGFLRVIPVSCGIVLYYTLAYIKQSVGELINDASVDITQKYVRILRALVSNRTMLMFLAVCAVGILVVYLLRTLSVDYAWILAIALGYVSQLVVIFAGDFLFGVSVPLSELLFGSAAALVIAGIYHFFVFAVDYSRTEYTQFEDDDYVYYVKAVPKVVVSTPDVRVQRINNPSRGRRGGRPGGRDRE